jgi:hypothetical protein
MKLRFKDKDLINKLILIMIIIIIIIIILTVTKGYSVK